MTSRYYTSIFIIALCLTIALTSFGQSENKKTGQIVKRISTKSIQFDTLKTAIILFDKKGNYPFDNSYKPTTLTQNDIKIVDSLLIVCLTKYNNSLNDDDKELRIDLKKYNYRKQLIVVINKKGEKEVWVNCLCHNWDNSKWKTEIIVVDDGGNCYFNLKINLTTKRFYNLSVNGFA
ncbi:MAG: hypothetical protein H7221_09695 [Flavobacterium sp.]|nr:hypothetical protein [Flavobacterium sp.]